MNSTATLTREKEMRLLQHAIGRAETDGLQVLLRDPESRVISCALCGGESDHPSMIRHAAHCSYSTKPPTLRP
jgi:secreted trypsin-like serine protease